MLFQHAATAGAHPLDGTVASYVWLLPLLPLLGFVLNGLLSLTSVFRFGPDDPGADHGGEAHAVAAHDHTGGGAHGDDHHPVQRHRYAGLVSLIGPGVLIASFGLALAIFLAMQGIGEMHAPFVQRYFAWMPVGDLVVDASFQLDQLSMVMVLIITGVGALIHLFSVGYMRDDPGYPRYFAYLNLFVFFMLVLVLGANYPILFIGWEGVGLCSYLLIGYWFSEKANADAGKKAFIVNRIGDFGFLIAMFILFAHVGRLDFIGVNAAAPGQLAFGGIVITAICLFLFLGCAGKSAQIPLYVWLPDAMAGPTPVSALIHAATMVTAGVYLIARSSVLFSMAPAAGLTVVLIGGLTAIFAASIGLKQWDIKKVLAYSTVSQLGFMFVGVGTGAYVAGVFHLMTHAFFKGLLFLGAGSVIYAMHAAYHATHSHEDAQDMRNMGGMRKYMPVTWVLMWAATLAIAGVPPFAGFFSKDEILGAVFLRASQSTLADAHWLGIPGSAILYFVYVLGLAAAFMTAVYMTRMMIYTFHGPNRTGETEREHLREAPWIMTGPLVVLGVLSVIGGWFNIPAALPVGPIGALERWLEPVVGESALRAAGGTLPHASHTLEYALIGAAILIGLAGIAFAFARLKPGRLVPKAQAPAEHGFGRVLANKYYVDEAYDATLVQPVIGVSRGLLWRGVDVGLIDRLTRLLVQSKDDDAAPGAVPMGGWLTRAVGYLGSQLQSGRVGTYAWVLVVGVLFVLGAFSFANAMRDFLLSIGYNSWILPALLALPVLGALLVAFTGRRGEEGEDEVASGTARGPHRLATAVFALEFILSLGLWWAFEPSFDGWQQGFDRPWIPSWGIRFTLGLDGIALMMVLLTTFIMLLASYGSLTSIRRKARAYYALLLVLTTGMLGVFMALDLFLFYVMWEAMLIPMYFIVGIWGGERRIYASLKFFIYTMVGSLLMLVGIVYLGTHQPPISVDGLVTTVPNFSYEAALNTAQFTQRGALWLFGAFFLAFAVKVPMFPLHTWLPDAHVEAPTAGSVVLASIMLKLGTFGFLRLAVPLFPTAAMHPTVRTAVLVLAVIGIVYGALVSLVQPDFKKLVAYSSVSHLGFVMLGIFALTVQSVQGALMVMINHGLSTGALFFLIGMIYERRHTRLIESYGGIARVVPLFAVLLTFVSLSSIGVPGTNGFVGEFLVLIGAFRTAPVLTLIATTSVIISAAYLLWAIQRILFNRLDRPENLHVSDLNRRELLLMAPLVAGIIWLGVYPAPVLRRMEVAAEKFVRQVESKSAVRTAAGDR